MARRADAEHDLSVGTRAYAFQHEVSPACIGERQDCAYPCAQLSVVDQAGDLGQMPGRDIDEEEGGFDAMALRKVLVRFGYRGNQLAAPSQNAKGASLRVVSDEIDDGIHVPDAVFEATG